ncbi:ABC transporter, ATP-binding protein [Streptococcus oralis]|jgi:ABC superfamily ATP binding cassette transporter, ABC protein|uniref:Multidrug ABC transporter ATP-binding protein n=6 Tax=Streptococcus oralis TaxID=1303 RepID=A0A1X1GYK8_STROR|nr:MULTISPECIES: ABC transporter ATP-binding protein [Streptococcus]MDU7194212.1 ABC transporter ATP-binding protein [Streptococcus sp.]EFU63526.1 ABC transporter, ATP-binding protein [Streptococcus oralis ATCC 49296]EIC75143.1 ABC transporter, ATP-binding protein [Streptococcus oralis SK610]EMG35315.1 ABC transporter ATP-binding protein [Streptococcus oralis subsp. tigurinus 1366]EPX90006.1 multidrug ABC transporter ATP-binding protein [Streptococcus oralis subsp. tigurinus 2425]
MTVIKVEKLSKKIKDKEILRNISFEINDGECVALIGPNGAGKTTLIDCLLGDKFVSSGQIAIQGFAPTDPRLKQLISILPQENTVVQDLKVKELLSFFQSIYPNSLSNQEIDDLLRFSDKQKNQLAGKLSGGQKRLFSFVLALIGRPKILFLDEPTAAMDTSTRQHFWEIVNQLKKNGVTIVYSSHYIEEVEHTADRILVLHKGELIRDTTPYAMRGEEQEKHFTVPLTYQEVISTLDQIQGLEIKQNALSFTTKEASQVWKVLQEQGCMIEEIEVRNRTLLDSIFETTQD